ncbi:MAG TPA: SDR family oxidoreductase [Pseudonocardiaceae bacterium]|jgi:3-oxoacyl-[acyl-carrier protein] reductase
MTNSRVALVTGGNRGIGAAITHRLAEDGLDIALTYRTGTDEAKQVAERVRALGRRVLAIEADLAEPDSADLVADAVVADFGRWDVLVNNAGLMHWSAIADIETDDVDRLFAVDARAPLLLMRAAARRLADGGRIVNIASGVTATALPGIGVYSGVKAFVDQVTKVAAAEFGARKITVNAVGPGSTATGPFAELSTSDREAAGAAFALGRIGEPEDTANLVGFLVSPAASFVTGQVIYAAGGQRGPLRTSVS